MPTTGSQVWPVKEFETLKYQNMMNLIKRITDKLRRKPLLVKPAVNNCLFSKEALELFYLAGFNRAYGSDMLPSLWKECFDKFYKDTYQNDC